MPKRKGNIKNIVGLKPRFTKYHDDNFPFNEKEISTIQNEADYDVKEKNSELEIAFLELQRINNDLNIANTALKESNNKLSAEVLKLECLYRNMNEGLILHELIFDFNENPVDYIILDINKSIEEILETTSDKIIGQKGTSIYGTEPPPFLNLYKNVVLTGKSITFDTYWETINKHLRQSVFTLGENVFASLFFDMTFEKEVELSMKENEERFRLLVENMQSIVYLCKNDPEWTMVYLNSEAEKITGYSRDEFLNGEVNFEKYFHPNDAPLIKPSVELALEHNIPYNITYRIIRKDGIIRWVQESGDGIRNDAGEIIYLEGFIIDITERKLYEDDIKNMNEILESRVEERTQKLEYVNKELNDFAYIVSHDLKAPLRGISQISKWLLTDYKDKLDDNGIELIELIKSRAKRMDDLINGVLQYSRIGRARSEEELLNLNELVSGVIEFLTPPVNFDIEFENTLPQILGERIRIEQLFQNLIGNAIKYNDKEIGIIKISSISNESHWQFKVSDNGPGIENKYFDKIFQIFQSLDSNNDNESTGIGLSLVKKITEIYGGSVWVESVLSEGTQFYFTLSK